MHNDIAEVAYRVDNLGFAYRVSEATAEAAIRTICSLSDDPADAVEVIRALGLDATLAKMQRRAVA